MCAIELTDTASVCSQCNEDYGLCERCYGIDKHCEDTSHIYTRYTLFKGEKHISKAPTEKDHCQFCKNVPGAGLFYCKSPPDRLRCPPRLLTASWSVCETCNEKLCETCYTRGAGCKDRTHGLMKCVPSAHDKLGKEYVKAMFSDEGKDHLRKYINDTRDKMNLRHKQ